MRKKTICPLTHREFLRPWFTGKEKPDGAWSADARWGDKNAPKPRYEIEVKWGGVN